MHVHVRGYVFYTHKLSCSDEMIICEFRNEDVKFQMHDCVLQRNLRPNE